MEYTYKIYLKDDTSDPDFNKNRKDFNYEGQDCYGIYLDGRLAIIQSDKTRPHYGCTIEEAAQKHIEDMKNQVIAEQEQAEINAKIEQDEKEAAEKRQKDLEDTVAKQTETLNMLTQLIASMQAQQMSLMNNQ